MTKEKTVEELQVEHSRLCALAADNGVALSDDLTAEFDTALVGRAINASINKQLVDNSIDAGLAKDPEQEQAAPAPKKKKTKAAKAETTQTDAGASQENEPMATTTKKTATKTKVKKTPAMYAWVTKKSAAKKAGAKKGAAKKKTGPRADSMTSKIIAKLKNGGITRAEVLKMTGWKAVSMQQLAGNAGVTLKKSEERPFKYTAK